MKTSGADIFGPHHVAFVCDLPAAGAYEVSVRAVLGPDQGILRLFGRDRPAGKAANLYAPERTVGGPFSLGVHEMREGENVLYVHLTGADPRAKGAGFELVEIIFEKK